MYDDDRISTVYVISILSWWNLVVWSVYTGKQTRFDSSCDIVMGILTNTVIHTSHSDLSLSPHTFFPFGNLGDMKK